MIRSYHDLILIPDFHERFKYLALNGNVGDATFGYSRYLNQMLYKMPDWKSVRRQVIIRDKGCDLAHPDYEINGQPAYVHHIEPISADDILEHNSKVFDLDNLITTVFQTHQAIHFGDESQLPALPIERKPNDTCPWR